MLAGHVTVVSQNAPESNSREFETQCHSSKSNCLLNLYLPVETPLENPKHALHAVLYTTH